MPTQKTKGTQYQIELKSHGCLARRGLLSGVFCHRPRFSFSNNSRLARETADLPIFVFPACRDGRFQSRRDRDQFVDSAAVAAAVTELRRLVGIEPGRGVAAIATAIAIFPSRSRDIVQPHTARLETFEEGLELRQAGTDDAETLHRFRAHDVLPVLEKRLSGLGGVIQVGELDNHTHHDTGER